MNISRCVDEAVCYEMIKYKKNGDVGVGNSDGGTQGYAGTKEIKFGGGHGGFLWRDETEFRQSE